MRTFDMLLDKLGSDTYHVLSFPVFHHVQRLKSVYYVFLCYTCHVTGEYEHARKKPHKLGKNRMLVKEKALLYYLSVQQTEDQTSVKEVASSSPRPNQHPGC